MVENFHQKLTDKAMQFKTLSLLLVLFLATATTQAAEAWKRTYEKDGESITQLLLISGDYFSWTEYKTDSGAFLLTKGGKWSKGDQALELTYEFHTEDPEMVGQTQNWKVKEKNEVMDLQQDDLKLEGWERAESETATPLTNPWLFSGRQRDGEISRRDTDRPRKTMKILTNNHFQWIAYNTETKEFFGTGGGKYEAEDGKYVEKIQFFSRDDSRVGAELEFEFDVQGDEWHHKGFSSSGNPMYEIWAKRTK